MRMDMTMDPELTMSVGTLLTRLEDRIEKRFDRVEEKMSGYARESDLSSLAQRTELEAVTQRVATLESRGWDKEMVGLARNNWPWIVAIALFLANNWGHFWHP
jgi:hypothetical protein